ncbi:MAG: hypothetical protein Q8K50_05635, partial [Hydrogenophaga sp.]|nr:hypothetical protein [Hydrogenophaga sp.]
MLYTDTDGRAKFRDETVALTEGTSAAQLSPLMPSGGYQLRQSPVGFRSPVVTADAFRWLPAATKPGRFSQPVSLHWRTAVVVRVARA